LRYSSRVDGPFGRTTSGAGGFRRAPLVAEGLVKGASTADVRHALEAALTEDRDRERALDEEVKRLLEKNAAAIRGADVDYAEMFGRRSGCSPRRRRFPSRDKREAMTRSIEDRLHALGALRAKARAGGGADRRENSTRRAS